jgi:hypothetical protein
MVFENRMLQRIFGPKRCDMTGGWRKLHNEELHNLYSSSNIIMVIKSRSRRCEVCGQHKWNRCEVEQPEKRPP